MEKQNPIVEKSYSFALNVIKICKDLIEDRKEWVLSRQLLKSGTSIGANVEEAIGAQSRKDFISKLSIANKEARETKYWLRLLRDSGYISDESFESLFTQCIELNKILTSIILTSSHSPNP